MVDSPEGVCPGQARFEYPATSVLFSIICLVKNRLFQSWIGPGPIEYATGVATDWFSGCARSAPGPQGRPNRPSSTISPGVGRRRRPIDGLSIGQTDSYVA
jgi:hypothetical protein